MAFELPGGIPNFTPQPVSGGPGPLDQYGKILQLKSLLGQQSLLPLQQQSMQQNVQAQTLENQQRQLELQSQQAMVEAWGDPDFLKSFTGTDQASANGLGFDPDAMTKALVSKGVLPKDALALSSQFIERSKNLAEIAKTNAQAGEAQATIRTKGFDTLHERVADVIENPDNAKQLLSDLVRNPQLFTGVPRDDLGHVFDALQGGDTAKLKAAAGALDVDKKLAEFHKSQSEATTAATNATVAKQKVIGANGLSPEEQSVIQKDVQTRKEVQPLELQLAQQRALMEQKLAAAGNSELANVPTRMIPQATTAANKADQDFAAAKSVSDRMAATMEAARKGNVVSYQIIPEEGTLQITTSQGVHRINKTEIDQYEGGGSLWQRMEGHFGKQLTGQSIPKSVLDDMADIQAIQVKGAAEKYHNSLASVNKRYGSTFSPVQMEDLNGNGGANAPVDPFTAFGGKKR